jgi:alanyl-tRNA synthetase
VILQARKLGKTVYLFSVDSEGGKVAHVNFVAPSLKQKGADARVWATNVSDILGGKVRVLRSLFALI